MAINFPNSPSVNETHTHSGKEWKWNGSSWVLSTNASSYTLPIATGIALGGIKVGSRLSIDSSTGVLDADVQGGTTTFTGLTDTPGTLTAGKHLKVNAGATALEYVDNTFTNLTDTPASLTAGKWLKVNAGGTALEETDAPSAGVTVSDAAPSSPSQGDLWFKSDEAVLKVRYEDANTNQWVDALPMGNSTGGGGASVTISDAAPTGPNAGDMWWDSDDGRLKIYYTDATPDSQWVDASPIGSPNLSVGNTSVSVADTGSNGTITFNTEGTDRWKITSGGHIIPYTNAAFDIGNAEFKVRHLFLSDNSLYFVNASNVQKIMSVSAGGSLQYDGKDLMQNVVLDGLDNNHTIKYNGSNWVNTIETFLSLADTPNLYSHNDASAAGKFLRVNSGNNALEFTDAPTQGPPPFQSNWRIPL